jgi:flagellar biosynthesis GTPase FlhF
MRGSGGAVGADVADAGPESDGTVASTWRSAAHVEGVIVERTSAEIVAAKPSCSAISLKGRRAREVTSLVGAWLGRRCPTVALRYTCSARIGGARAQHGGDFAARRDLREGSHMNGYRSIRALAAATLAAGVLSVSLVASADVAPPEKAQGGRAKAEEMKEKAQEKREEAKEKREEAKEKREEAKEKREEAREERQEDRQENRKDRRAELKDEWKAKRDEWQGKRKERREERRAEIEKKWGEVAKSTPARVELRIHAMRVARIERVAFVAEANGNAKLAEQAKALLEKENTRHQKRMEALSKEKAQ